MPNRSRKKKPASSDPVQIARRIVDQATGVAPKKVATKRAKPTTKGDAADIAREVDEGMGQPQGTTPRKRPKKKPATKSRSSRRGAWRKGGLKGGKARAATMTPEDAPSRPARPRRHGGRRSKSPRLGHFLKPRLSLRLQWELNLE